MAKDVKVKNALNWNHQEIAMGHTPTQAITGPIEWGRANRPAQEDESLQIGPSSYAKAIIYFSLMQHVITRCCKVENISIISIN